MDGPKKYTQIVPTCIQGQLHRVKLEGTLKLRYRFHLLNSLLYSPAIRIVPANKGLITVVMDPVEPFFRSSPFPFSELSPMLVFPDLMPKATTATDAEYLTTFPRCRIGFPSSAPPHHEIQMASYLLSV